MNKAVFLDRDGVINIDYGYVHKVKDFEFIPGVFGGLWDLQRAGYKLIIITDQSGIGRGYYTLEDMERVHEYMKNEMEKHRVSIDKIYYCPHAPEDNCDCRKPNPKMVLQGAKEFDVNIAKSYLVGDKTRDVQTALNAGCKSILVLTGKAGKDKDFKVEADFTAADLKAAAEHILDEKDTE